MQRAEHAVAVKLQLAPVRLDELRECVLVAPLFALRSTSLCKDTSPGENGPVRFPPGRCLVVHMQSEIAMHRERGVLVLVAAASFMVSLDALVVTTALPTIGHELGASLSSLEWTV